MSEAREECPGCKRGGRHTREECVKHHPERNPDCPACLDSRRHPVDMYNENHPGFGEGEKRP